jgi:uncharacterized protein YndB with AHSA1/START domain
MSPDWPLKILSTVTLAKDGDKTIVTVRWLPYEATERERETFEAGRDSMKAGWTGTFDRLDDYLLRTERPGPGGRR